MKKVVLALCLSGLVACSSQNTDLQAQIEKYDYVTVEAETEQTVADPKVNVLFVVDNSGSMKGYQEKLAKNMELFTKRFFANPRIDYKIGVVPVYDSKYLNDKTVYKPSGVRKMNPLGELVPLKGLAPEDNPNQLYITRNTINPAAVLQETVAIGVQWGPEAEESFSPVLAVTNDRINTEKNQNFYDKEAYLAIVFLTDADDVTPGLSGEEFYQKLVELKGGDRSKIFIAAALPNATTQSKTCTTDGHGAIQAFPSLLAVSGAIFADLCSKNFGTRLAEFAQYLVQRVSTQRIPLGFTPDISTLEVSYGLKGSPESERIPIQRGVQGYIFDTERNEVTLRHDLNVERQENGIIFVRAIPANLANYQNGRLVEIE